MSEMDQEDTDTDDRRIDECPDCETVSVSGWVAGHHYCPSCDQTFDDSGEVLCHGRYIDSTSKQTDQQMGSDVDGEMAEDETGEETGTPLRSIEDRVAGEMLDAIDTHEQKNADYGGAWWLASATLSMWCDHLGIDDLDVGPDSDSITSLTLYERRLEKLIRAFNGEFEDDDLQVSDESIIDSHADAVPYAAMHATLTRHEDPIPDDGDASD